MQQLEEPGLSSPRRLKFLVDTHQTLATEVSVISARCALLRQNLFYADHQLDFVREQISNISPAFNKALEADMQNYAEKKIIAAYKAENESLRFQSVKSMKKDGVKAKERLPIVAAKSPPNLIKPDTSEKTIHRVFAKVINLYSETRRKNGTTTRCNGQ